MTTTPPQSLSEPAERHTTAPPHDLAGEGQKGMPIRHSGDVVYAGEVVSAVDELGVDERAAGERYGTSLSGMSQAVLGHLRRRGHRPRPRRCCLLRWR